jgi:hypothetical protein
MNLGDQIYWWFHGGGSIAKGGHFNWKHYCKVMQAKHEIYKQCTDYNTTSTPNSSENGCSTAEDSASGSKESSSCQEIAQWDTLKSNEDDTRAID